jgi:ubiquinone/menaquinone biosynthesis C-methylase UbiE
MVSPRRRRHCNERNLLVMADHICPWWMGYLLANPLRRLLEKPEKMLGPFLKEGMTAVDYGCGMGFFTLPMARLVGPAGKVIAVDVQQKMLNGLLGRADRAGLSDRIEAVVPYGTDSGMGDSVDFVAALYVVHELPDANAFFSQMRNIMKPGARILIVEPGFHVKKSEFLKSVETAASEGLKRTDESVACRGWSAVLELPE